MSDLPLNALEAPVVYAWRSLPWRRYTRCSGCGSFVCCAGSRPHALFCLDCFDEREGKT